MQTLVTTANHVFELNLILKIGAVADDNMVIPDCFNQNDMFEYSVSK